MNVHVKKIKFTILNKAIIIYNMSVSLWTMWRG